MPTGQAPLAIHSFLLSLNFLSAMLFLLWEESENTSRCLDLHGSSGFPNFSPLRADAGWGVDRTQSWNDVTSIFPEFSFPFPVGGLLGSWELGGKDMRSQSLQTHLFSKSFFVFITSRLLHLTAKN